MSFYDASNSVNLDDVKAKLEQQAKDANTEVTAAIKNLETNADDPSKLAELQHAINKCLLFTISMRPRLVRLKM